MRMVSSIAVKICCLVNSSLVKRTVLNDWKKAKVTPPYKGKGSKYDANSYRPISVISHFAKILEKCVQYQLMSFLSKHDMITPDQSAYLRHHSTQTALLKVRNQWYETIEDGLMTGMLFWYK